jgi:hypothetical protein
MFAGRIERRARARAEALAERLREALPDGVRAAAEEQGVVLAGRGLRRRFARDAGLRAAIAGALK